MLKNCPLFDNGGNYSQPEIDWYRSQMDEIDTLFSEMMEKRKEQRDDIKQQAEQLQEDPTKEFNLAYTQGVK
jgi:gas vesicle protein